MYFTASPKDAIPIIFSVPPNNPFSCEPYISGSSSIDGFLYKTPVPFNAPILCAEKPIMSTSRFFTSIGI